MFSLWPALAFHWWDWQENREREREMGEEKPLLLEIRFTNIYREALIAFKSLTLIDGLDIKILANFINSSRCGQKV